MKNQYAGDIGDYGKYGLLRYLLRCDKGLAIGINWYLTENDGSSDGKFTQYLKQEKFRRYDAALFDALGKIAFRPDKNVQMVESAIFPDRVRFYSKILTRANREAWHKAAMSALENTSLVFCDPDNGAIGKKRLSAKDANKYVAPQEIADYYNRGQNVVYYCQRARRNDAAWTAAKSQMQNYLPDAKFCAVTYHKGTQRSYIFVLHPADFPQYLNMLDSFLQTDWRDFFTKEDIRLLI